MLRPLSARFRALNAAASAASELEAKLPAIYLVWAICLGAVIAYVMPPWQNPDEGAHLLRATQISLGKLIGSRVGNSAGGLADVLIYAAGAPISDVPFHDDARVGAHALGAAAAVRWGPASIALFPNTAVDPPFLYAASLPAIWFGRLRHMSIVGTLRLVRLSNLLASALLGAMALARARRTRLALFATLTLPGSIALATSAGQDALLIALVIFVVGTIDGMTYARDVDPPVGTVLLLCSSLLAVVAARPPYVPLLLLIVLLPVRRRWVRLALMVGLGVLSAAWVAYVARNLAVQLVPSDPAAQMRFVLLHPLRDIFVVTTTLYDMASWYVDTMIGVLGWLDTWLPRDFLVAARWLLLLALLSATVPKGSEPIVSRDMVAAGAAFAAFLLVMLALYMTWTPVGAASVGGVQGRYLLALLPPLALGLPRIGRLPALRSAALAGVLGLAACTPAVMILTLVRRYYLAN